MHISTDLILKQQQYNAVLPDKKIAKHTFEKPQEAPKEASSPLLVYQRSIQDVITQLMRAALMQTKSKLAILEFLQQNPLFKNLGIFSQDLKALMVALKEDFHFEKSLLLLQNFQKHIHDVDAKTIKMYLKNSGLFFESTLAYESDTKSFSEALDTLFVAFKEHLLSFKKTAHLHGIIEALFVRLDAMKQLSLKDAQALLKEMLKVLREATKEHLASEHPLILKPSYTLVNKLEIILQTASIMRIENQTPLCLSLENDQEFKVLLYDLRQELMKQGLPNLIYEIVPQLDTILQQTNARLLSGIKASLADEALLQEKLTYFVSSIKQEIVLFDAKMPLINAFIEQSNALEQKILSLLKPEIFIAPEIMQKLSIPPSDAQILGDIKGVLVRLSDKLLASSHPNATSTLELANRLITHIEYYQLVSYVEGSNHLYLPFVWEGLKEGSMMIKQSKKDAFHCQLDLDLEYYGKLSVMLLLYQERYISLSITTQKNELKQKVQERLKELEKALTDEGMIVQTMKVSEYKEPLLERNDYFSDETLQFGINITI